MLLHSSNSPVSDAGSPVTTADSPAMFAGPVPQPPPRRPPPDVVTYSQYVNGSILSVPKSWQHCDNGDSLIVSVYGFLKTFLGASGTNQGAIDNRIEQAMDLVKSHLMNAVRSEVEELKEKIIKLEDTISHLQAENELLKTKVAPEALAELPIQQQQPTQPQPPQPQQPPPQQQQQQQQQQVAPPQQQQSPQQQSQQPQQQQPPPKM